MSIRGTEPDITTTTLSPAIENLCKHYSLSSIAWYPHSQIQPSTDCVTLCMHAKSLQSCLTLWDPMGCSPPGSSVQGILQARILEWVAMPSRGSSRPRDRTCICLCLLHWQAGSLPLPPGKPPGKPFECPSHALRSVSKRHKFWRQG